MSDKKTYHKQANGVTVVKERGKIVTNLAAPSKSALPKAAPNIGFIAVEPEGNEKLALNQIFDRYRGQFTTDELFSKVEVLDAQITELRLYEDGDLIRLGDLEGITEYNGWDDETILDRKEAIDLLRLQKAILREQHTDFISEDYEKRVGVPIIEEYGEEPLGIAEVTGTYEINSVEWLLSRAEGIGGSDKIGHVDENNEFVPYDGAHLRRMLDTKTPEAIERIRATGVRGPLGDTEQDLTGSSLPVQIGNRLERTIQTEFALNNPEKYRHFGDKSSRIDPNRPYHRFNPDGVLLDTSTGNFGIFEAKTSRDSETYEKALPGYKAQCLHNAAAAFLPFAVLVADIEGEPEQRVVRLDFTAEELSNYRKTLDRVWRWQKPEHDRRLGNFR